jgi:hypothetical protein
MHFQDSAKMATYKSHEHFVNIMYITLLDADVSDGGCLGCRLDDEVLTVACPGII